MTNTSSRARRNTLLSGACLASCFALLSCGLDDTRQLEGDGQRGRTDADGSISFDVIGEDDAGNQYQLDELQVVVEAAGGATVFDGPISVEGSAANASFFLKLPVGDDYELSVSGTGTGSADLDGDGQPEAVSVDCRGSALFDLGEGNNDPIPLLVTCYLPGAAGGGQIGVNVEFKFGEFGECGLLTVVGGPLVLELGDALMTLNAVSAPNTELQWSVSPDNGTFANDAAATTTYDCHTTGPATIRLTVTGEDDCEDFFEVDVLCTGDGTVCGNDLKEEGELCDGVDTPPGEECTERCTFVTCGDNFTDGDEECDDGNTDDEDGCSASCVLEECGDDIVQQGLGEECEPPDSTSLEGSCDAQCHWVCEGCGGECGNNVIDGNEECDGTNVPAGLECSEFCTLVECGDFRIEGSEQCDDGNTLNGDGCSTDCQLTESDCGNDQLDPGEECDDGNRDANDGCSPTCQDEYCGDGIQQTNEECDDGNTVNTDECTTGCVRQYCGDGILQSFLGEECDDGGPSALCNDDCTFADVSCDDCTQSACPDLVTQCNDAANGTYCRDVLTCYADTGCAINSGLDTTVCLCGTYDAIYCAGGQADGACQSAVRAAANPGGNNATVLNTLLRWTDSDFPVGDANLLADCERGPCGASCPQYSP